MQESHRWLENINNIITNNLDKYTRNMPFIVSLIPLKTYKDTSTKFK